MSEAFDIAQAMGPRGAQRRRRARGRYFFVMFQNTVTGVSSTPSMLVRSANG